MIVVGAFLGGVLAVLVALAAFLKWLFGEVLP